MSIVIAIALIVGILAVSPAPKHPAQDDTPVQADSVV